MGWWDSGKVRQWDRGAGSERKMDGLRPEGCDEKVLKIDAPYGRKGSKV